MRFHERIGDQQTPSGFPGILRTGERALSFIPYRPWGGGGGENKEAETSDEYKREVGEEIGFSFSFLLSFFLPPLPSLFLPPSSFNNFWEESKIQRTINPPQFLGMHRSLISFFFLIADSTNISLPVIGVQVGFSRSRESLSLRFLFSGLLRGSWLGEQAQEGAEDRHGPGGV